MENYHVPGEPQGPAPLQAAEALADAAPGCTAARMTGPMGGMILAMGMIALLTVPSWATLTLYWLTPLVGLVALVVAFIVANWWIMRWVAGQGRSVESTW